MQDKFSYTYNAPTQTERREIENIRNQYKTSEFDTDKLKELRQLNRKAKLLPVIIGILIGVLGFFVFNFGIYMILKMDLFAYGIVVNVVGFICIVAAYFVYGFILKKTKKKYADKILALSDELLSESTQD